MLNFLSNSIEKSALQRLHDAHFDRRQVAVFVKRDDEIHPSVSGNKFRKLRYNLAEMQRLGLRRLVTFGGAFSNHIHAVAAAGALAGFETVGVIRGESTDALNPTLAFAQQQGMHLQFVSRSDYRDKAALSNKLKAAWGDFYLLPEGGSNVFAVQGTAAVAHEVEQQLGKSPDFLCAPCGTGGTLAGLIAGAKTDTQILGFSALKGDFLPQEVTELLSVFSKNPFFKENTEGGYSGVKNTNWQIQTSYHFGGYARWTPELVNFINLFKEKHGIQLDPIYTGKLFFGIYDLVEKGFFPADSTIVAVHTGGVQGIAGFNQRFGTCIF